MSSREAAQEWLRMMRVAGYSGDDIEWLNVALETINIHLRLCRPNATKEQKHQLLTGLIMTLDQAIADSK